MTRKFESLLSAYEQAGQFLAAPLREIRDLMAPLPGTTYNMKRDLNPASLSDVSTIQGSTDETTDHACPSLTGRTIERWDIQGRLGQGGMGEVYRAQHVLLQQPVAIKRLAPAFRADQEFRRRFVKEAQYLFTLKHPNIVHVFDVFDHGEDILIVMDYVDGESLRTRLRQARFTAREFLEIAVQCCRALEAAHDKNIVHLDIKPENILLTRNGEIKVCDFGIAKRLPTNDRTPSAPDAIYGASLAYAAPEILKRQGWDQRSDIYSLGVVLREVLNLVDDPTMSTRLDRIVCRMLQLKPEHRYQTAAELENDLMRLQQGLAPPVTSKPETSIAVLPFVSDSSSGEDEYFGVGVAEEVMNALMRVPGLRVASRTSAFSLKGGNEDIRIVGEKLNVSTVLEGTVRRIERRLRVTVRLTDAVRGYQLWSESYDREMSDVFAVQEDIARSIVTKLKVEFGNLADGPLVRRYTENIEAYSCYLQGRYHLDERIQVHLKKSVHCFRAAIVRDPKYALAYAGLADAYATFGNYRRAKSAALKAIEIDDTLAAAHTSIGFIRMFYDRDWAGSEQAYTRALELDPLYPTVHHWYALYLEHALRFQEAIQEIRRAHELDPLSLIISAAVARVYLHAGQVDDALRQCNKAIDLDPDFYPTYGVLTWIYRKKHMFKEALSTAQKAFEVSHGDTEMLADLAIAYALTGRRKDAEEILRRMGQRVSQKKRMPPYYVAAIYAALGDHDRAFEWLDRAYQRGRATCLDRLIDIDPLIDTRFDSLRSDPRFERLLERSGIPSPR